MNKKVMSALFIGIMINTLFVGINIIDTGTNRTSYSEIENEPAGLLTEEKPRTLDITDEEFNCFVDVEKTKEANYDSIPVTRAPPDAPEPKGYEPVIYEPFNVQMVYPNSSPKTGARATNKIYVLVDSSIYSSLETYLTRYASDLENWTSYTAVIYQGSWGSPQNVRTYLQGEIVNGIVGALLVGDIPAAWFEIANDYGEYGYASFPIDLFYADLDGNWVDAQTTPPMQAGVYDDHTGSVGPDIYVGRLKASGLAAGSEVALLQNYFDKNHLYRIGSISMPHKALVYIDDDWIPWADDWSSDVGLVYTNRTLVKDGATTNSEDYKNRLTQDYEWIHLAAHSTATGHALPPNSVSYSDITNIDPHCLFYNLFCCSAARYTETNCIGSTYIFTNTYGLGVVGSTKTGGMLDLNYFYNPLATKTIGESFKDWFTATGESNRSWFYGMTVLGDPVLSPTYIPPAYHDISVKNLIVSRYVETGETIMVKANVTNVGQNSEANIVVHHQVNGVNVNNTTITSLPMGAHQQVSFSWRPNVRGNYLIGIYAEPVLNEDPAVLSDNWNNKTVDVFDYYFFDDMESGAGAWTHKNLTGTADDWMLGTPDTIYLKNAYSDVNCWGTNLTGNYQNSQDAVLVTGPIDLKGSSTNMSFWHYCDWEGTTSTPRNWDGGFVEIWDGNKWGQITPIDGYDDTLETQYGNPLGGHEAFCHDTNGWVQETFVIDEYVGRTIKIRFHIGTDGSNGAPGWYIDDLLIYGVLPGSVKNLGSDIWGDNVTLNWSAPFAENIEYYLIYRSTTADGFTYTTPYHNTSTDPYPLAGTWNDTVATDMNNYFYVVRCVDTMGRMDKNTNLVGKRVIQLSEGWNYITLPLNTSYETAEKLANAIGNCTAVSKWNTSSSSFDTHYKGTDAHNFTIDDGVGYLIYVNCTSVFTITGKLILSVTINLKAGWNSIGWNNSTKTTAENLCQNITNCTAVAYWNSTLCRFIVHPTGTNISNFDVEIGNGYFVYVTTSSTWK